MRSAKRSSILDPSLILDLAVEEVARNKRPSTTVAFQKLKPCSSEDLARKIGPCYRSGLGGSSFLIPPSGAGFSN